MASESVTGKTEEELAEMKADFDENSDDARPFHKTRCLAPIARQPESYDGPTRYCAKRFTLKKTKTGKIRCKFHGAETPDGEIDNLEKLAAMKHGMKATREHLIEDFDDKDQALYDWIMETYPDAYDLSLDEDPNTEYDLHRLAAEIVRAERGRGYLIREGEIHEKEVYGDDGVVLDEHGNIVTEKSEHYLAQMMHRQDKKITKLQKELGITRKEQLKQESTDKTVEAIKGFAELGSAFLDRENTDYDPDDKPWEDTDGET